MSEGEIFDIIFVGGGSAGCVAAGRLASANRGLKILILEAGPHSLNIETYTQPARCILNLGNPDTRSKCFAIHVAQPSEAVANRAISVATGQVLGGGSSVNLMVYTRGSASDYDAWEDIHENPGWGSKDLIPLLKGIENYGPTSTNSTHGKGGPIRISRHRDNIRFALQFLEVAGRYDPERGVREDWNDFKTANGYGLWAKYIDDRTGKRSDTAHNFIYNQADNKNLRVLTESRAVRVLFEGTRAIGVEYKSSPNQETPTRVLASKLVVISAGAFGSPPILERSGIGAEHVLRANGIASLVDLPGVGANYQDHSLTSYRYVASRDAETMDDILRVPEDDLKVHIAQWRETGEGMMAHTGVDAGYKLRPSPEDLTSIGPAFKDRWNTFFVPFPDKPVALGALTIAYTGASAMDPKGKYFALSCFLGHPSSSGTLHIAHGLDPYAPLNFRHSFLESEADVAVHRWGYKHLREVARRMPLYRGELQEGHPIYPTGSNVACKAEDVPVNNDAPKLVYTAEDDAAIDEYHRQKVGTTWHSLGTCAMKPRDKGGVVDSRLNVYGTTHLKVADLSICPGNVSANTHNTALAVGAKAAVLIAEDLGLKL